MEIAIKDLSFNNLEKMFEKLQLLYKVCEHYGLMLDVRANIKQRNERQVAESFSDGKSCWEVLAVYKHPKYNNDVLFCEHTYAVYFPHNPTHLSVQLEDKYIHQVASSITYWVNCVPYKQEELISLLNAYENKEDLPEVFNVKFNTLKVLTFEGQPLDQKLLSNLSVLSGENVDSIQTCDPYELRVTDNQRRVIELISSQLTDHGVPIDFVRMAGVVCGENVGLAILSDKRIFDDIWENFLDSYSDDFELETRHIMAIKVINECVSNKLSDEVATLEKKMELLFGNDMPGELSSMYQQFKDVLARY
tara:strand:- start:22348 stop:23265 length:918 start_codon:yes stop_codon:yes gene_type:complete